MSVKFVENPRSRFERPCFSINQKTNGTTQSHILDSLLLSTVAMRASVAATTTLACLSPFGGMTWSMESASLPSPVLPRMAVVRPFSVKDATKLPESFNAWKDFPPCSGHHSYTADLVLAFSQSIENSHLAVDVINKVASMFEEAAGFGRCFKQILTLGCNIEPEFDIYNPEQSDKQALWVNGPNRAFATMFRAMTDYDFFFQMEMDTVPVEKFWLDSLMNEIGGQEFAILGSRYRGYKWDAFYDELPLSLRSHINGNALYNTSHIVLKRLVTALEQEVNTTGIEIPYDLRMEQILEEAKFGYRIGRFEFSSNLPMPPTYSDLFADLNFDLDQVFRETPRIGNFAATNMVPQYLGSEIIVHGAKMHRPWDCTVMGNVTLVVSDWNPSSVHLLLKSLELSFHPFSEVLVMVPAGTSIYPTKVIGQTPVRFFSRGETTPLMDICTAPVKTPWMMKSTSFFQIRQKVPLMTHDGKPVVTFSYPTKETCYTFQSCVEDIKRAKLVNPSTNRVFDELDMVYHIESLDRFCSFVDSAHRNPSPTEYVAHLDTLGKTESLYCLSERRLEGLHSPFIRIRESLLPTVFNHRRLPSSNSSVVCIEIATEDDCLSSGCEWRESMSSCRFNPNNSIEKLPRAPPTKTRPKYITALIIISIVGASIALVAICFVAYKRDRDDGGGASDSLDPLDGSGDADNHAAGERSDVDSSLLLASEFESSRDGSIEEIDLTDGRFEETSTGIEYVHN
jgi:hypothetical protein